MQVPPPQLFDLTELQRAANRIYGYSAQESIGRSITMLAREEDLGAFDSWFARVLRGESIDFQGARDIFLRGHR